MKARNRGSRVSSSAWLSAALGVATLSGYLTLGFLNSTIRASRVPLDANAIVTKCRALNIKPGPSASFHERTVSDRFQTGTNPVLIRNATIWTGHLSGYEVVQGDILLNNGLIQAVGRVDLDAFYASKDVQTIDAYGAWVTPGLVDAHAHVGVYSSPELHGALDVNSGHGPVLPWLRALDALNTHDDGFAHTLAGGVTTALVLPGSGNAIGGQGVVLKLRPTVERSPSSMLLEPPHNYVNGSAEGADVPLRWRHMKHACGENPSRSYGLTRMDTVWAVRQAYDTGRKIKQAQDAYCEKALAGEWHTIAGKAFPEDLQWEAVVDILRGRVKVQTHCYEELDLDNFVRLSNEFQFPIAAFHHAAEAYLVPNVLKEAYGHVPAVAIFATFGRPKREFYRVSEFAPRILADSEIDVMMKSDHPALLSRYLMHEAAQAHYYGLAENLALSSVISTPARVLGLDHRIGYLKEGYDADVVIWDSHPLSLGALPTQVIVDGIPQFEPAFAVSKPASHQAAPITPDFDAEAAVTLKYEGLPPLFPEHAADVVVFTNISNVWLRDVGDGGVVSVYDSAQSALPGVLVARRGRVVCSGTTDACASYLMSADAVVVDLQGGAIQPGLVALSPQLGLEEIEMEASTVDGLAYDPLLDAVPAIVGGLGYLPRAVDGLQYGTRNALLAHRAGTTVGIVAPAHRGTFSGLSTAFSLGSAHKLESGAIVQTVAAVHVTIARDGFPSVSTKIAALRRLLLDPPEGESGQWYEKVAEGKVPLVVEAHSADIMATLIGLKAEVETATSNPIQMTFVGATEAHLIAKELAHARIGVILSNPRPYPSTWDQKRIMAGPPVTEHSQIAHLVAHNVTVGITGQGLSAAGPSDWAARNVRFDAAWALVEAPDVLTKASALALASTNVEKLLGVHIHPGEEDLVATSGGDLLSFEGKVVSIISPRRETVDLVV